MSRLVALVLTTFLLAGCGYRLAGTGALFRDDVRSVAVPVVGNETFYRSDTVQLTDALVRQVQARTPYRIAPESEADTVLEVTITGVDRRTITRDRPTALPQEQLYIVRVDLIWKDLRDGQTLASVENLEQTATQYATLGEDLFAPSQQAAEELAAGIVDELVAAW